MVAVVVVSEEGKGREGTAASQGCWNVYVRIMSVVQVLRLVVCKQEDEQGQKSARANFKHGAWPCKPGSACARSFVPAGIGSTRSQLPPQLQLT